MDKESLELFKRAISEGVSNRFDKMSAGCTEEILYSEKHKLAMRTIVYGKAEKKRAWSPRMRRIVAILVAAAILLTSCGIIFRNEIREVFNEISINLIYGDHMKQSSDIEEVYVLNYIPNGYRLEKEIITARLVEYVFLNGDAEAIVYSQGVADSSEILIDNSQGYTEYLTINGFDVYHRFTGKNHIYVWKSGRYVNTLETSEGFSNDEITLVINGITTK